MKLPLMVEIFKIVYESVDDIFSSMPRWNKFSKSLPEFEKNIDREARKYLGNDWKDVIEKGPSGGKGSVDKAIKEMWKNNFTDFEAVGEVGVWYDGATSKNKGLYGTDYIGPGKNDCSWNFPRPEWDEKKGVPDPNDPQWLVRPGRPSGIDGKGELIYSTPGQFGASDQDDEEVPDLA